MRDAISTTSSLAGLALAATVFALSYPAFRNYWSRWTRRQKLKFAGSILLCVVFGLLWIPLVELLTPRNAAGQPPPGDAVGMVLVALGWIWLGVLLLLRYLMDEPQPKWIRQFGAAYLVPVLMVAAGISILVVIGYG